MRRCTLNFYLLLGFSSAHCQFALLEAEQKIQVKDINTSEANDTLLAQSNNIFSGKILTSYQKLNPYKDFVLSPFSISSVLNMAYWGSGSSQQIYSHIASSEHNTDSALSMQRLARENRVLNEHLVASNHLRIANALFLNAATAQLTPSYQNIISQYLPSENIQKIDLQNGHLAAPIINDWVQSRTQGKIKKIVDEKLLNESQTAAEPLQAVLLNAIDFEQSWPWVDARPKTTSLKFSNDKREIKTLAAISGNLLIGTISLGKETAYALPLGENNQSFYIIKTSPRDKARDYKPGSIHLQDISEQLENMSFEKRHIVMPKLNMTPEDLINLRDVLSSPEIGLNKLFEPGAIGAMIQGKNDLYFKFLVHNVHFDLNEKGISAAAATAGGAGTRSITAAPRDLVIDQSFDFAVIHQGVVIFVGHFGANS